MPESVAATISAHKSVPSWSAGWQLEFHGTSLYGVSSALAVGEILPSESDNSANGTACGRGAYTSQSHAIAARYGICHYFGEWNQPGHSHLVKMFLLVAIPGAAAEALPEAEWQQVDRTHLSKRGKKRKSAFQLTEDDARLKRVAMRLGEDGQGTVRERDWTTQAPGYSQATYLIKGLCARGRRGGAEPSGCAALRARREAGHGHNWLGGEGRIAPGAAPPLGAYALRGLLGAAGLPLPEKFAFAQHVRDQIPRCFQPVAECKTHCKMESC